MDQFNLFDDYTQTTQDTTNVTPAPTKVAPAATSVDCGIQHPCLCSPVPAADVDCFQTPS